MNDNDRLMITYSTMESHSDIDTPTDESRQEEPVVDKDEELSEITNRFKKKRPGMKIRLGKDNAYDDKERSMTKNEKPITWSKIWVAITGSIFFLDLVTCIILVNLNTNILDTAVMVTSITVTGAIFGSNLCWYSKKSASENHYKLRMAMYEDVVNQRLYFTEEMLKLRRQYIATEEEIAEIDGEGEIAGLMDEAFSNMNNKLNQEQDEYEAPNEIQNFNL